MPRPDVPAHWSGIEARYAVAAHEAGIPTPMVLDVVEVDGRASIVFERVDGLSMLDRLAARQADAERLALDMAELQREMHRTVAPADLPELRARVAGKIATADAIGADERTEAGELLRALPGGSSVCHGDMHPGNILIGERGLMVIDWFDAASGPPIADIVRSSLLVRPIRDSVSPPYLPGANAEVLRRFHRTHARRLLAGTEAADALRWESVLAVSRLSEPVGADVSEDMMAVWRGRDDPHTATRSPLAEVLLGPEPSSDE